MGTSYITALKTMRQSCVLFTALIGQPSTGKTTAMGIVKDALNDLDIALGRLPAESHQINSE
jgi:stage III sporulation protein SpoIIIAA